MSRLISRSSSRCCHSDPPPCTTRIACAKSADESKEVFILDFDFSKTEPLAVAKLQNYLSESHDRTKRVFEAILTEDYKAVMRGEAVE